MKRLWATAFFLLMATIDAGAATFSLPEAGVSFEAPDGFTELSQQEMAHKYLSNQAPSFVVGNKQRTTTIAFDLKPYALQKEKLHEAKASFEALYDRMVPGIEWKQKKLINMQGQTWIYFELTSRAIDTDIYNIILVTPLRGKMLLFNFNSTKGEFPELEMALRKSIQTISLRRY